MSINRLWHLAVPLLMLVISTSACGNVTQDEPVTLTWAFWGTPEEVEAHKKAGDVFMAEHPGIKIEYMIEPQSSYFAKIQTLWDSGNSVDVPDVLLLNSVSGTAEKGQLENLDPLIEEGDYGLNDYWPALIESVMHKGSVYGLPNESGVEVLYYNKDMFDEAGLEYPTDNWTWDDLLAAADMLTEVEGGGRVAHYGLGMEGSKYQLWIGQNGGSILDNMHNPSKCTLTELEAMEAVKFFSDLMNNGFAIRDANLSQAGGDSVLFADERVAMIIQNSSRVSDFNRAGINYDVVPVPIPNDGQRSAGVGGEAWAMSALGENKEEAWVFLSWLQSADGGQKIYTASGNIFPVLQSVAHSDAFLQSNQPPVNRQAFLIEGENAKTGRFGTFPEWDELEGSIINPGLQRVWAGQTTPKEGVSEICRQIDAFLKEKGYPK